MIVFGWPHCGLASGFLKLCGMSIDVSRFDQTFLFDCAFNSPCDAVHFKTMILLLLIHCLLLLLLCVVALCLALNLY